MFGRKVRVDSPEGPKVATMVEGSGVFICRQHEFSTEDINKFNMHLKGEGHALTNSVSNCIMCNKPEVSMEGVPPGQNAICDECQIKLSEQAAQARKRLAKMREK